LINQGLNKSLNASKENNKIICYLSCKGIYLVKEFIL